MALSRSHSLVGYNPDGRPKDDFYPTPEHATVALLNNVKFTSTVWEPACGDGAISTVLQRYGYDVISTDLYDHGYGETGIDFLTAFELRADSIVTNPPFKHAQDFLQRGLDLGAKQIAMLLKLAFLEGETRTRYLETTPLKRVMVFRKRLTMTRNGELSRNGGMIAFAWYYWEYGYKDKPMIEWI